MGVVRRGAGDVGVAHHQIGQPMSDNLRTRIAAAIYNASDEYARKLMVRPDCPGASELEGDAKPVCYELADAVIRELALTQQFLVDGIISDGEPRPWELPCETRYATEWERFDG